MAGAEDEPIGDLHFSERVERTDGARDGDREQEGDREDEREATKGENVCATRAYADNRKRTRPATVLILWHGGWDEESWDRSLPEDGLGRQHAPSRPPSFLSRETSATQGLVRAESGASIAAVAAFFLLACEAFLLRDDLLGHCFLVQRQRALFKLVTSKAGYHLSH